MTCTKIVLILASATGRDANQQ